MRKPYSLSSFGSFAKKRPLDPTDTEQLKTEHLNAFYLTLLAINMALDKNKKQ